jgi:prepilin-type N-terminal cleavage/methylation domain-containing protein
MGHRTVAFARPSPLAGGAADQRGFTLVETLAAIAIIVVALVGLLTTMTSGVTDIDSARRSTTALFLAEQRLEHIRAFALSKAAGQGYNYVNTASFPAEAYGTITNYGDYRRTVVVVDDPGGTANTKQVEVWVFYRPVTTTGLNQETSVVVSSLLAAR